MSVLQRDGDAASDADAADHRDHRLEGIDQRRAQLAGFS